MIFFFFFFIMVIFFFFFFLFLKWVFFGALPLIAAVNVEK